MKFVPVAVSVKAPLPTAAVLGAMELNVGTGLFWAVAEPKLATRIPRRTTASTESRRLTRVWQRFQMAFATRRVSPTVAGQCGRTRPMVNGSVCCFHGSVCYLMAQSAAFMAQAAEVPWAEHHFWVAGSIGGAAYCRGP